MIRTVRIPGVGLVRLLVEDGDTSPFRKTKRNREMVDLRRNGWTQSMIAEEYGISKARVSEVLRRDYPPAPRLAPGVERLLKRNPHLRRPVSPC